MIILYSRASCSPCATLKYWLSKRGVEYQEREPDESVWIVPTVEIAGERIEGLNLPAIASILDKQTVSNSPQLA